MKRKKGQPEVIYRLRVASTRDIAFETVDVDAVLEAYDTLLMRVRALESALPDFLRDVRQLLPLSTDPELSTRVEQAYHYYVTHVGKGPP